MLYLLLYSYKILFGILIYHYCFMDNHIHRSAAAYTGSW